MSDGGIKSDTYKILFIVGGLSTMRVLWNLPFDSAPGSVWSVVVKVLFIAGSMGHLFFFYISIDDIRGHPPSGEPGKAWVGSKADRVLRALILVSSLAVAGKVPEIPMWLGHVRFLSALAAPGGVLFILCAGVTLFTANMLWNIGELLSESQRKHRFKRLWDGSKGGPTELGWYFACDAIGWVYWAVLLLCRIIGCAAPAILFALLAVLYVGIIIVRLYKRFFSTPSLR